MSYHSARSPRGFGSLVLRSLAVSSLLLGGLLQPAPAWAAHEEPEAADPVATIADLAVEDGMLVVGILWSKPPEGLPELVKIVSRDGKDEVNDSVGVRPEPGLVTKVKLENALKEPWTTGWAQKLVLEDPSKAEVLLTQPYDINLSCETATKCRLVVAPGIASNPEVIHVSEELEAALAAVKAEVGDSEFDLLEAVGKQVPGMYGEALVYAQQMAQWLTVSTPCTCVWTSGKTHTPGGFASPLTVSTGNNGAITGWEGPGAAHGMTAVGITPGGVGHSLAGKSSVVAGLSCSQWTQSYLINVGVAMSYMEVSVPFPRPVLKYCTLECKAQFDHLGRISAYTGISYSPGVSTAGASQLSYYRVDGVMQISGYAAQGTIFDNSTTATRYSNTSTTGTVDVNSYASATSTNAIWSGSAFVGTGYALAIYGTTRCQYSPRAPLAVYAYPPGSNGASVNSLKLSIKNFFQQRGYYMNP